MLKTILVVIAVLFVGLIGFTIFFGKEVAIDDQGILETYQPTPEIAEIVDTVQFSDSGKALFYRADPEFVDVETFREMCLSHGGIELAAACIKGKSKGDKVIEAKIYLLELDDPQFADQRFPSAVHETLHMAYRSMSKAERARVGELIKQELELLSDDEHLASIMSILERAEGPEAQESLIEEVHSILGTEYSDLSEELESYYSQYFIDRQQVVAIYQNSTYAQKRATLEKLTHQTQQLQKQLQTLQNKLNAFKAAGDNASYNQGVNEYNRLVNQYNALVRQGERTHQDIEAYYQFVNPFYQVPSVAK